MREPVVPGWANVRTPTPFYNGNSSAAFNSDVPIALKDYFYYDESTNRYQRSGILYDNYTREQWLDMIYTELDKGRPILYGGSKEKKLKSSGHAFVIDGYDGESGKVHVNWGWNGYCDGEFDIDMLNPNSSQSYNFLQDMVLIVPGKDSGDDNKRTVNVGSSGGGSLYYGGANGTEVRSDTRTFTVTKGNNVILYVKPDEGNVLKSLIVDGEDVTSQIVDQEYTISNVTRNIDVKATFVEAGDLPCKFKVVVKGEGTVYVGGVSNRVEGKSNSEVEKTFEYTRGTTLKLTINPAGTSGRIKSVALDGENIKFSEWFYSQDYTIDKDAELSVSFIDGYELTIESKGDGSTKYGSEIIRNESRTFDIKQSLYAYKITLSPDDGNEVQSLIVNGVECKDKIDSDNCYSESSLSKDVSISVTYASKSVTEYDLTILTKGDGTVVYSGNSIRQESKTFKVKEGESVKFEFKADKGFYVKRLVILNINFASLISNNEYTVNKISNNTSVEIEFAPQVYKLVYKVDDEEYKSFDMEYGAKISPEPEPIKDGYTFSGWSDIPETMPDHDVTVTGEFSKSTDIVYSEGINSSLNCGTYEIVKDVYGEYFDYVTQVFLENRHTDKIRIDKLVIKNSQTKEEYLTIADERLLGSLSGNSTKYVTFRCREQFPIYEWYYSYNDIPCLYISKETDFNLLDLSFKVSGDGKLLYKGTVTRDGSLDVKLINGARTLLSLYPDKGAYIKSLLFNQLNETSQVSDNQFAFTIEENTIVNIEFAPNKYNLVYIVDGEEYKSYEMEYGTAITSEPAPKKEGYTFSGWSDIPKTMPDHDVTVTGTFTKNPDGGEEAGINESLSSGITSVAKVVMGNYADVKMSVFLKNSHSDAIIITQLIVKHPVTGETLTSVTDDDQLGELKGGEQKNVSIEIYYDVTPTLEWHYTYKGSSCIFTQQGTDVKYHFTIESTGNGVTKYKDESLRNESKTFDIKETVYSYILHFVPDEGNIVEKLLINGKDCTSKISDNSYKELAATSSVTISVSYAAPKALSGDANSDGSVDVSDVVSIVNYILGKSSTGFDRTAADVNDDGSIDVSDVVATVNIILGKSKSARSKDVVSTTDIGNDFLALTGDERDGYAICLSNVSEYTAAQFDVYLSEGMSLQNMSLNPLRCGNHQIAYSEIDNNLYRVLIYNIGDDAFAGNSGELLKFNVSGNGSMIIRDIKFVTNDLIVRHFAPQSVNTTSVFPIWICDGKEVDVYDMNGKKVRSKTTSLKGLPKGVYIINGRKVTSF